MNISNPSIINIIILISLVTFTTSCNSQKNVQNEKPEQLPQSKDAQIDEYVVEIFEDSKGNLWFGTINSGAAKYDGKVLSYLTVEDGLIGNTVTSFAEDKDGRLWIGTHSGLSKYDGQKFTNYNDKDGLINNTVSELLIDKKGTIWVGTWGGVSTFDGTTFSNFPLPNLDVELLDYQNTMKDWTTEIIEDKQGNIWISRDGYGACIYDGKSFTHYTKKDGLTSNNVQVIHEDKHGNLWFGSRVAEKDNPKQDGRTGDGGLSMFDGKTFIRFDSIKGLNKNDIYAINGDNNGNIWIGANGLGAYRYNGKDFTLFRETDRADLMPYGYGIQNILADKKGNVWFGLSGGLFRLVGNSIANVTQNGPWK
jgi:ligand-binding sensor domain-containing protein